MLEFRVPVCDQLREFFPERSEKLLWRHAVRQLSLQLAERLKMGGGGVGEVGIILDIMILLFTGRDGVFDRGIKLLR